MRDQENEGSGEPQISTPSLRQITRDPTTDQDVSETPQSDDTALEEKALTCVFPTGCDNPRETKDPKARGAAPKYCVREDHNALSAYRAKQKARRPATEPEGDDDLQVTNVVAAAAAEVVNVREVLIQQIGQLRQNLDRFADLQRTVVDPEAFEATALAVESEAAARIANAEQRADADRSQRLVAERAAKAAEEAKTAAEDATDLAVQELDAATTRFEAETQQLRTETDAQIEQAKADAAAYVERVRQETEGQLTAQRAETERVLAEGAAKAAEQVQAALAAAEQAKADAAAQVEEMSRTVATANTFAANAKEASQTAQEQMRLAQEAADELRKELQNARQNHTTDADRAAARITNLEGRVDSLRNEATKAHDKASTASTALQLAEGRLRNAEEQLTKLQTAETRKK